MRPSTDQEIREAIKQGIEHGPRDEEEFLGYAGLELLGEAYEELTEAETEAIDHRIKTVAQGMGINTESGEQE